MISFDREPEYLKKEVTVAKRKLTWVLNLDSGVRIRMRFVNYLCARLLGQNLGQEAVRGRGSHTQYTEPQMMRKSWRI